MKKLFLSCLCVLFTMFAMPGRAQVHLQSTELALSLIVTDSVRAKQFYGECLNLPFVGYGNIQAAKMLLYKSGDATIKVRIYEQTPPVRNTALLAQNGIRFITIPVSDFDSTIFKLNALGFPSPQISIANNIRTAMAYDADSNRVELIDAITYPSRKFEIGLIVGSSDSAIAYYTNLMNFPVAPPVIGTNPIDSITEYRYKANETVIRFYAPVGSRPTYNEGIAEACGYRYITFTLSDSTDFVYDMLIDSGIPVLKVLAANPSNPTIYVCMFHGPGGATHEYLGPVSSSYDATLFTPVYYHEGNIGQATILLDIDGDSLLDFATANKEKYYLVKNHGEGVFSQYGEYSADMVNGFGSYDLNGDGMIDISLAQQGSLLYPQSPDNLLNNGAGSFTAINLGNESIGATRNIVFGDLNNDGFPESYHSASAFGNSYEANQLHQGLANGMFGPDIIEDVLPGVFYDSVMHPTLGMQYRSALQSKGVIMRDFDLDGKDDIANAVYIDLGFQPDTFSYNYVLHQKRGLFLFKNTSTGNTIGLHDVSLNALGNEAVGNTSAFWNAYSPIPFDYDRDGDYDLIVGGVLLSVDPNESPDIIRLYENISTPGSLLFVEKTVDAGLEALNNMSWNAKKQTNLAAGIPIDYNNDGWTDIIFVNRRNIPNTWSPNAIVFRNNGDKSFTWIPFTEHGIGGQGGGRDINYADLNYDGKQDIIISDGTGGGYVGTDSTIVYLNADVNSNNWVGLDVKVSQGGTWAFGCTVKILDNLSNSLIGMEDIRTDFCYRSKRNPVLHFGLGNTGLINVVISKGDTIFQLNGLAVNQIHHIYLNTITGLPEHTEGKGIGIYPNPTQGMLTISNLSDDFSGMVSIYNPVGQLFFSEQKSGSTFSIETEHLNSGIYFVQIKGENGEISIRKFVKQ